MPTLIKLNTPLPASAACERLFSAAGRVFVPRRGRISDKHFEQQLLAYSNKNSAVTIHDIVTPKTSYSYYMVIIGLDV